jgi:beta-glucosidase-like glycosyl hydrolase
VEARIDTLLKQLSLEEKVSLVAGSDMWHTPGVPRLGIPGLKVTDGPSGARGGTFTGGLTSASFPCGSAIAATWSPELALALGEALAEETRSKGCEVLLGPTVNLHRHPLGGRHFECYAEDPALSAEIAVAWIRGLQRRGVACCVKHYVANDSEFERMTISSDVPERALRELYLLPFEHAVKRAGAWSVMSAYNRVNGTYASEQRELLRGVLKGEWGFDGAVISDWFGTHDGAACARGGLDVEMPGPPRHYGAELLAALRDGAVPEDDLDDMVRRVLRLGLRTGAFERAGPPEPPECADDRPAHRALARRLAAEAIVLLKNDGGALPFAGARPVRRLAVIGPNARYTALQGGGSARVSPHYEVSALAGIRASAEQAGVEVAYAVGCPSGGSRCVGWPAPLLARAGLALGSEQLGRGRAGRASPPLRLPSAPARSRTGSTPPRSAPVSGRCATARSLGFSHLHRAGAALRGRRAVVDARTATSAALVLRPRQRRGWRAPSRSGRTPRRDCIQYARRGRGSWPACASAASSVPDDASRARSKRRGRRRGQCEVADAEVNEATTAAISPCRDARRVVRAVAAANRATVVVLPRARPRGRRTGARRRSLWFAARGSARRRFVRRRRSRQPPPPPDAAFEDASLASPAAGHVLTAKASAGYHHYDLRGVSLLRQPRPLVRPLRRAARQLDEPDPRVGSRCAWLSRSRTWASGRARRSSSSTSPTSRAASRARRRSCAPSQRWPSPPASGAPSGSRSGPPRSQPGTRRAAPGWPRPESTSSPGRSSRAIFARARVRLAHDHVEGPEREL